MPSGLDLRVFDREFRNVLASLVDIDRINERKENYWFVNTSNKILEVNRKILYTQETRDLNITKINLIWISISF